MAENSAGSLQYQEPITIDTSAAALNKPVSIGNDYVFGDWITGRLSNKNTQRNQAAMDYAEWMRNEYSAQSQRRFEEFMDSTKTQRAMKDLEAAGLNPLLAVEKAGLGGSVPQGASASSSAGQVSEGGSTSPGTILAGTAVGIAAILKVIAKFLK